MKLYLGPSSLQLTLLPEANRRYEERPYEVKETVETDSGYIYTYMHADSGIRYTFFIEYDRIKTSDYNIIEAEYRRQVPLVFRVFDLDNITYRHFWVVFQKLPPRLLWKEMYINGVKERIYENVNFVLQEVRH